jgi:hypothetical protein
MGKRGKADHTPPSSAEVRNGGVITSLTATSLRCYAKLIKPKDNLYYYYLVCEAIGTAATPGLLCQPRVIVKMIVEKQM